MIELPKHPFTCILPTAEKAMVGLLGELIALLRESQMHSIVASIIMPNTASMKLHEKAGFQNIGHLREAGFKNDQWHDVTYWQLVLAAG